VTDVAVFSCDVGLAKPDPAIYRVAADRLGADPTDCVFIGGGADDDSDPSWEGRAFATIGDLPAVMRQLACPGVHSSP
jgi:putative hydrolase of the HAD superfamily